MDPILTTLIVVAILFLSSLVRSAFGFGDALVAMPLLAFAIDLNVARPLVALISLVVAVVILSRDWRSVHTQGTWRLIVAAILGIPVGMYVLDVKVISEQVVKAILAALIISYSLYSLTRPTLPRLKNERMAYFFGFLSGVLGGAYNTAGPPLVIYGTARRWAAISFRATMQSAFLPISTFIVVCHGISKNVTSEVWIYFGLCLPAAIVGVVLGKRINRRFHNEKFIVAVYLLLILIGVALLLHVGFAR